MELKYKLYELPFFVECDNLSNFVINYYLIEHHYEDLYLTKRNSYGILLEKSYSYSDETEISTVPDISPEKNKVVEMIHYIFNNSVTTVGLKELIYDLI